MNIQSKMRSILCRKLLKASVYQSSLCTSRLRSTAVLLHEEQKREHSTVDEEDVKFYNVLGKTWWDENGEMRALHALNKLRIPLVRDGLINSGHVDSKLIDTPYPLKGLKILEIGCGGGILSEPLARIGATVTGVDASQNTIDTAKAHASQDPSISERLEYVFGTVEEHVKENRNCYDAVVASEVLEHVNQKDLFVQECVSTLKPGGSIFFTTLNRTYAMWISGVVLGEYILRLVRPGTHDINKCMMPHELQGLLEKNGCTMQLLHGMMYNFLTNEWYWSSNSSMNYAVHAVRNLQS